MRWGERGNLLAPILLLLIPAVPWSWESDYGFNG